MIRTLQDRGVHLGIDVYMECTITRLLKDGDRIAGAFGYWREQGRFVVFRAKSVILCTGGIGKAWKITSNSWEYTGDGMALAYDAGADLMDMEFVQFHPTGMVWPPGVHITKGPMEVGPTCHYMMGGIRVDAETAQASIPGLFAAGEAAVGLHGANRLGGNSLSDLLVFGRRAGLAAAEHAKGSELPAIDSSQIEEAAQQMLAPFERQDGDSPYVIHDDLQSVMQSLVGIFRDEQDLRRALSELDELKARAARVRVEGSRLFNPGWHLAWDLHSMLTVAEAVTRSALARRESRGAHSRIDYPGLDDAWGKKHNVVVKKAGTMTLVETPVLEMPDELKQLLAEESGTK